MLKVIVPTASFLCTTPLWGDLMIKSIGKIHKLKVIHTNEIIRDKKNVEYKDFTRFEKIFYNSDKYFLEMNLAFLVSPSKTPIILLDMINYLGKGLYYSFYQNSDIKKINS